LLLNVAVLLGSVLAVVLVVRARGRALARAHGWVEALALYEALPLAGTSPHAPCARSRLACALWAAGQQRA
jgi:hypothetical protein